MGVLSSCCASQSSDKICCLTTSIAKPCTMLQWSHKLHEIVSCLCIPCTINPLEHIDYPPCLHCCCIRAGAAFCGEMRNVVFARVSQSVIRNMAKEVSLVRESAGSKQMTHTTRVMCG